MGLTGFNRARKARAAKKTADVAAETAKAKKDPNKLNKPDLVTFAQGIGIEVPSNATKPVILGMITAKMQDEADASTKAEIVQKAAEFGVTFTPEEIAETPVDVLSELAEKAIAAVTADREALAALVAEATELEIDISECGDNADAITALIEGHKATADEE